VVRESVLSAAERLYASPAEPAARCKRGSWGSPSTHASYLVDPVSTLAQEQMPAKPRGKYVESGIVRP